MKKITQEEFDQLVSLHLEYSKCFANGKPLYIRDTDLSNIKFSPVVDLNGTRFSNCSLIGMNLLNINLSHANFYECDFRNAKMRCANLSNGVFYDCDFSRCDLGHSSLERSDLSGSIFIGANLSSCNAKHARLYNSNLNNADLCNADLSNVNLVDATLLGTNLYRTVFDTKTTLPYGSFMITGYYYNIFIHKNYIQVGCQNHTVDQWLNMTNKKLNDMGGKTAIKFYPTLLKIIKFYFDK